MPHPMVSRHVRRRRSSRSSTPITCIPSIFGIIIRTLFILLINPNNSYNPSSRAVAIKSAAKAMPPIRPRRTRPPLYTRPIRPHSDSPPSVGTSPRLETASPPSPTPHIAPARAPAALPPASSSSSFSSLSSPSSQHPVIPASASSSSSRSTSTSSSRQSLRQPHLIAPISLLPFNNKHKLPTLPPNPTVLVSVPLTRL